MQRRRIRDRVDFFIDVSQAVSRTLSGKAKAVKEYIEDLDQMIKDES